MRKTVVFCEGKNDIKFVKKVVNKFETNIQPITFYGEDIEYSRLNPQEAQCLRKFLKNNIHKLLTKSEEGKNKLKDVFTHVADLLNSENIRIVVMTDTDTDSEHESEINNFTKDLSMRFNERHKGSGHKLQPANDIDIKNSYFITKQSYIVNNNNDPVASFTTVAWKDSLEVVADVKEDYSDIDEKIENLSRKNEVKQYFAETLL